MRHTAGKSILVASCLTFCSQLNPYDDRAKKFLYYCIKMRVLNSRKWLGFITFYLLAVTSLCWCVYRDIHIEMQHPNDLRNRVVGSRLQLDGLSPYFYHWKSADGIRYYDWSNNWPTVQVSNITATPFFHQLLYPIANLPQRTVSKIWLVIEYLVLLVMTVLALWLAKQPKQKWAVVITVLLFLHCYGWRTGIEQGQMYILIPLLALLFYVFITGNPSLFHAVPAGIVFSFLLLVRPNTILFFLPFILLAPRYNVKYKMLFSASFIFVFLFALGSSHSRLYWSDYRKALDEHVRSQHDLPTLQIKNPPVPVLEQYEGWNRKQVEQARLFAYHDRTNDQGNVFVLLNMLLHKLTQSVHVRTPLWVLSLLCIIFMLLLCTLFYRTYEHTGQLSVYTVSLLGFYLYMTSDLFSPVHRANYNASQWIFPLLLTASTYSSIRKIYIAGILTGLLLNSMPVHLFRMQHSLGEYLLFASLLGILFFPKPSIHA